MRALLVPAVMKLLGEWNWYLPDELRKVLRLQAAGQASWLGGEVRSPGLPCAQTPLSTLRHILLIADG